MSRSRSSRLLVLIVTIIVISTGLSGCKKDNPVNVLPSDVAGAYYFTDFQFVPDASAIQPANVLDTLVAEDTYLRLISSGQFILNYRFRGGQESIISGDFSVTTSRITLRAAPGSEARLISLMLNSPIVFNRSEGPAESESLTSYTVKTVDLASFSAKYAGVPPVRGTLQIGLRSSDAIRPSFEF